MTNHILKCTGCGKYTMQEICACGAKAVSPRPAKYSPEDQYGRYRRETKRDSWKQHGML